MIDISKLLDESIEKSVGCTELAAIGLAVSAAFNATKGRLPKDYLNSKLGLPVAKIKKDIVEITVKTDIGVFKNTLGASLTYRYNLTGTNSAAAAGVFCDPSENLKLLGDLDEEGASEAANLLKEGKVSVTPNYGWDELRIEAEVTTKDGMGRAYILKEHSNIVYIEVDGKPKFEKPEVRVEADKLGALHQLSDLIEIIEGDLSQEIKGKSARARIAEALRTNHKASIIAERIFSESNRGSIGLALKDLKEAGYIGWDCINLAEEKVCLAVEGRMSGFNIGVMTCAGSGTMGVVATLPLISIAMSDFKKKYHAASVDWDSAIEVIQERAPEDWAKLVRAVGLVYLIADYVSIFSGKLSPLCGCGIKVGPGLAAGIAYYLTPVGDEDRSRIIGQAINNAIRGIIGMICDGAKMGCALKAHAATEMAMRSALIACLEPGSSPADGIANEDVMLAMRHLGEISKGTKDINRQIIEFI